MKNLKVIVLAVVVILAISSCSKDDEPAKPPVVEEEVFTTVTAVFTPVGCGTLVTLTSRDLDGDGPTPPDVTVSGPFAVSKTYDGEVTTLDESKTPIKDMTDDILELPLEHQLFYVRATGNLPAFTYTPAAVAASNYDVNGKPIGLKTIFTTGATASAGVLKIILRHEGNKSAANVASGDITNATGATDFEVDFAIAVQ